MQDATNEFSFILKPAEHGIGVFAAHDIAKGVHLAMFGEEERLDARSLVRRTMGVPEPFRGYCMDWGTELVCPKDFSCMPIGWYLNHSKAPNAERDKGYRWYASRDIRSGEEITIDYNSLEEPEEVKEDYYRA
jgi:SET domain-containing protein